MSADNLGERRRHDYHNGNLQGQPDQPDGAEVLRYLAENDDLPVDKDDEILGQLVSKVTSTSNLSDDEVESNKWIREIVLTMYLAQRPPEYGIHGTDMAWVCDDMSMTKTPLAPDERTSKETFTEMTKLKLSQSEDFKAVEESTRDVSESIVNEENGGSTSGGIMGKLGLR